MIEQQGNVHLLQRRAQVGFVKRLQHGGQGREVLFEFRIRNAVGTSERPIFSEQLIDDDRRRLLLVIDFFTDLQRA